MTVTTNADSGGGSLRAAIEQINSGTDSSNTIHMQIPGNSPISLTSDLPVIKKNTTITSTGKQPIHGNGQYRLFATIMADLTLNQCILQEGAAIGGDGGGGGMGAGGGVYIDRGQKLSVNNVTICNSKAQGGNGGKQEGRNGGGGASFSSKNKHGTPLMGGGDYPGLSSGEGGRPDGSIFLVGYGGGDTGEAKEGAKGGGNGPGLDGDSGGDGGYCGGGGGIYGTKAGGGGNGGGAGSKSGGGGGFGSGGAGKPEENSGGGGFGGGGGAWNFSGGGGGFGGGGGRCSNADIRAAKGGRYGGNAAEIGRGSGGGWNRRCNIYWRHFHLYYSRQHRDFT